MSHRCFADRGQHRIDELRRCGCRRCYEEYRQLTDNYYPPRYYDQASISPPTLITALTTEKPMTTPGTDNGNAMQVSKIKNPAIKLLTDRLNIVEATRKSNADLVTTYKGYIATYGAKVADSDEEAAALRKALKRLGRK